MSQSPEGHDLAGVPQVGAVLAGKYKVERVLGVGGMGAVVAATHLQLEERVAIKTLHESTAQNAELVARFLREGKSIIKIRSEHAVKVYDVGTLDNGAPYLVMEHLVGDDLSRILETQGPMPVIDTVDLVLQACEAVAEAHALGIVHRDLKPANLFLTHRADGSACIKVLDFGISKAQQPGDQDMGMTKTQTVMGSPRYMSPEQMRSTRNVDARTDIWALGTILYELLTGAPPFNGETMTELCAQILQDLPPALTRMRPDVPRGLEVTIERCLAKNPDERFANLAHFAAGIAEFGTAAAKSSADRIARVLKVQVGPSGTARLSQRPPGMPGPGAGTDPNARPSMPGSGARTDPNARAGMTAAMPGPPYSQQPPPPQPPGTLAASSSHSGAVWGSTTGARPPQSNAGLIIGGVIGGLVLLLGAIAVVVFVVLKPKAPSASATPPVTTQTSTAAEAPSPSIPPPPIATSVASAEPSAAPATSVASAEPSAAPATSATAKPSATVAARVPAPAPPKPTAANTGTRPPAPPATQNLFDGRH